MKNPILRLISDDIIRKIIKENPKAKNWFKLLTKKEREKLKQQINDSY